MRHYQSELRLDHGRFTIAGESGDADLGVLTDRWLATVRSASLVQG